MASILRSSKFVRLFASITRSIVISQPKEIDATLIQRSQSLISFLQKDFSTVPSPAVERSISNVDKSIKKLDLDVRRSGRVSSRELQEIIDEIRNARYASSTQSLMVIRCCGNLIPEEPAEVRTKLVQNVWETLDKLGVTLDISHYNALLRVYIENDHNFSPSEFLRDLEQKGVEPNRVTFQRLIAAYCQKGDIDGATKILEFMKEKQMPVNESVFNALILGHSQANDMESAEGMLKVMKQANIEPSAETYTVLLCGYARKGDLDSLNHVFSECTKAGVSLYDRDILEVIYTLGVSGHEQLIDNVAVKLQKTAGFNQDAKNVVLRLVARGEEKTAVKVLSLMTPISQKYSAQSYPTGLFLIRQMVKTDRPYESIIQLCQELQKSKENERALLVAIEASLVTQKPELSLKLLDDLSKTERMCQHYYWPVLVQFGKKEDIPGILKTLRQMMSNMGQPPTGETLREYVVQFLPPGENGVMELRKVGISLASASSAMVFNALQRRDMKEAVGLVLKFRANYNSVPARRALVSAFMSQKDIPSLVTIVQAMCEDKPQVEDDDDVPPFESSSGQVLLAITNSARSNKAEILTPILQAYLERGIGISSSMAELIQSKLSGEELTQEISTLLSKLTSPDLVLVPLNRTGLTKGTALRVKDDETLLGEIKSLKEKGESPTGLQRQLFMNYYFNKDLEKAVATRQEIIANGEDISLNQLYILVDLYILNEKLNEAMKTLEEAKQKDPNSSLDEIKTVRFAHLLFMNNRRDEALNMLKSKKLEKVPESANFMYSASCWKLLNFLAETKDPLIVNEVFNILRDNKLIEANNVLLGPLIKVHILNNDLNAALTKFEECCLKYHATPWKNEITCKLIQKEDAVALQKLTDLSTQIHGEVNSLYDLVLAFVECGRIRQARKILETPGLRARSQRLNSACERYENEGQIEVLENLVQVTKDMQHIDRADICYRLLSCYSKADNVDKSLSLWTLMQDEDVQPSDKFFATLAALLAKHNRPIPFAVPEMKQEIIPTKPRPKPLSSTQNQLKTLRRAIQSKDIDKVMEIKENVDDSQMLTSDRSSYLNFLINCGRNGVASKFLLGCLQNGLRISVKSLDYALVTFAKSGDVDTMSALKPLLSDDLKKLVSFSNRYAHGMVSAGKVKELLASLEADLNAAKTPEEMERVSALFPRGGIYSVFTDAPEFIPEFEKLSEKYRQKGLLEPLNVLWVHNMVQKNFTKADSLWQQLKSKPLIMFQPILKYSRSQRDLTVLEKLMQLTKDCNFTQSALGTIHSCIIDVHLLKEELDQADKALNSALNVCQLVDLSTGTLHRMKRIFEGNQREFKYEIPQRKSASSSSSSSSSDSEKEH